MKHLIIFSIGPVQDFISTARRSRDLWYGSWMLSELARAVSLAVEKDGELIFPSHLQENVSVPNKIVAIASNAELVVKTVNEAIEKRLIELRDEALNRVGKPAKYKRTLAEEQIKDLPELYWVSVPYEDGKYKSAREEAEALLAARKATRNFKQMKGDYEPKSSLDGSRESVIDESEYPKNNVNDTDKENAIRKLYENYRARQGERLSGVDLLKRLGGANQEPKFSSTSHMAAIPFMEKLKDKKSTLISNIRDLFAVAKWEVDEKDEGSLLFESRILDLIPSDKKRKALINSLSEKIKGAIENDSKPNPYYALIAADGDFMGKVIDAQENETAHRTLSKTLSEFASEAPKIVETNNGLMIYSGGDDVLAYLPINKALQCAKQLNDEFAKRLEKFSTSEQGKPIKPSLSVGIVIAHHLDPLSDVLQLARDAEKKAKQIERKNGLAITLSKRSGTDRTIVGKFAELHARLEQMIDLINKKIISGGTAYELQELERTLSKDFDADALQKEARRIVEHKQAAGGKALLKKDKEDYLKTFEAWTANIKTQKDYSLHDIANEMIIAKELAID